MNVTDLLIWARGPGLVLALAIFVFGVALRLFENFSLGRKADLAPARGVTPGSGWRTVFSRSLAPPGMFVKSPAMYIGGYVFHLGFFITVLFAMPHVEFVRGLLGISWRWLPTPLVDAVAVITMLALLAVLADRLTSKVKRLLSGFDDYLAWLLTVLPLVTGYCAYHHIGLEYTLMLTLHILAVELLLVLLPFTKLFHTFSLFVSRWYCGDISGRKGVAV